jgi:hypothetical protein
MLELRHGRVLLKLIEAPPHRIFKGAMKNTKGRNYYNSISYFMVPSTLLRACLANFVVKMSVSILIARSRAGLFVELIK